MACAWQPERRRGPGGGRHAASAPGAQSRLAVPRLSRACLCGKPVPRPGRAVPPPARTGQGPGGRARTRPAGRGWWWGPWRVWRGSLSGDSRGREFPDDWNIFTPGLARSFPLSAQQVPIRLGHKGPFRPFPFPAQAEVCTTAAASASPARALRGAGDTRGSGRAQNQPWPQFPAGMQSLAVFRCLCPVSTTHH